MPYKRTRNARGRSRPRNRSVRRRTGVMSSLVRSARRRYRKKAGFRFYKQVSSRSNLTFLRDVHEPGSIFPPIGVSTNPVYALYNISLSSVSSVNNVISNAVTQYRWYRCYKAVLEIKPFFWSSNQGDPFYRIMLVPNTIENIGSLPSNGAADYESWPSVGGYRETSGPRRMKYIWRPRPVSEVPLNSGSTTDVNAGPLKGCPWLSTISPSTVLYGPMVACRVDNNVYPSSGYAGFRVIIRTYWMFKNFEY